VQPFQQHSCEVRNILWGGKKSYDKKDNAGNRYFVFGGLGRATT
jgi:hypothetical protein